MKEVYRKQIDALLAGDVGTLNEMYGARFDISVECGMSLAHTVWGGTGGQRGTSIFSTLPGCENCLTQVKGWRDDDRELMFYNGLKLEDDNLIPDSSPPKDWHPTREVLEHFAKLQEFAETFIGPEEG